MSSDIQSSPNWAGFPAQAGAPAWGTVFNGFAVRTDEESVFRVGLLSNLPLVAAEFLGIGIISAISYVPLLQSVFHTAPLSVYDWLMLIAFGVVLLIADEIRKAVIRSRRPARVALEA